MKRLAFLSLAMVAVVGYAAIDLSAGRLDPEIQLTSCERCGNSGCEFCATPLAPPQIIDPHMKPYMMSPAVSTGSCGTTGCSTGTCATGGCATAPATCTTGCATAPVNQECGCAACSAPTPNCAAPVTAGCTSESKCEVCKPAKPAKSAACCSLTKKKTSVPNCAVPIVSQPCAAPAPQACGVSRISDGYAGVSDCQTCDSGSCDTGSCNSGSGSCCGGGGKCCLTGLCKGGKGGSCCGGGSDCDSCESGSCCGGGSGSCCGGSAACCLGSMMGGSCCGGSGMAGAGSGIWRSMCNGKAYPDAGWAPPTKNPLYRTPVQYQAYWPHAWYGSPGSGYAGNFPQIYRPTDTTQLGYSYHNVPRWLPNPSMMPAAPVPSMLHTRGCPNGRCAGDAYGRPWAVGKNNFRYIGHAIYGP